MWDDFPLFFDIEIKVLLQRFAKEFRLAVKEVITSNPKTAHEICDKTSSLDYLSIRAEQAEPLYAIEHTILEYEITTLNLLNEICRLSNNPHAKALTDALLAREISFYQNNLDLLFQILPRARKECETIFDSPLR